MNWTRMLLATLVSHLALSAGCALGWLFVPAFRAGLESVVGPLSPLALASQMFGLYTGFVYFTPVLGGIIADRWIGQRNAVVIGALLMSGGHIAMGFD